MVKIVKMDKTFVIKDDFCFASAIVLVVRSFITSRSSSIDRLFLIVEDLDGFEHWLYMVLSMFQLGYRATIDIPLWGILIYLYLHK